MPFETALPLAAIGLRPLSAVMGAEVSGLDLARPLEGPVVEVLHDALLEHGLLLLRDQRADAAALATVARQLAAIEAPLLGRGLHQAAPALPLTTEAPPDIAPFGTGAFWHADRSYDVSPSLACLAMASAGEIAFADQRAAAARLPSGLAARIATLRAAHRNPAKPNRRAEHPVLRRHPITGESSLYISPAFTTRILNLPETESRQVLGLLIAAATDEAVVWRHRWQPGDVLLWDNRRLLHTAWTGTRLRIEGDQPVGAGVLEMPWVSAG